MKYQAMTSLKLKTLTGLVEIFPGQAVRLQPERALQLVETGKLKPFEPEADIGFYLNLRSEAISRIHREFYPQAYGWIDWLKGNNPNLWEEIEAAEKVLESPVDRGISLEQFSNLVSHWENLYRQAIESYLILKLKGDFS